MVTGMSDRINVLLRDDNGVPIGTGTVLLELLDRGPVHVSVPWWPTSSRAFSVELRLEGEPAQVDGAAAEPAPEPAGERLGSPRDLRERPEPAAVAVTFTALTPEGKFAVRDLATPARTLGAIADELAERLGLRQPGAADQRWTFGARDGAEPYAPGRHLNAAADGQTLALVPVGGWPEPGK